MLMGHLQKGPLGGVVIHKLQKQGFSHRDPLRELFGAKNWGRSVIHSIMFGAL